MAARPDLPRLQAPRPSIFNAGMSTLGTLGMIAGGVGGAMLFGLAAPVSVLGLPLLVPVALAGAGALAGGALGGLAYRGRMQQEYVQGRVVQEPALMNKGLMTGLFLGGLGALGYAAYSLAGPATAALAAGSEVAASAAAAGLTAATGALVMPLAVGIGLAALAGSFMRYTSQRREFATAYREGQIATVSAQAERARAQGLGQYMGSVTPQESQKIEALQQQGKPGGQKSYQEQILADRALASTELAK